MHSLRNRPRGWAVGAVLALLGGCSCGEKKSVGDAAVDQRIVDHSVDRGNDHRLDLPTGDRGADRGPDLVGPPTCGGSRTLTPVAIPTKTAQDCGPACRQISWGATPSNFFEIEGSLVTYNEAGPGLTFVIDLAAKTEHRLRLPHPTDVLAGCYRPSIRGSQIVYTCIQEWPAEDRFYYQSISTYDVGTKLERDLLCRLVDSKDDGCFPFSLMQTPAGVAIQWTLSSCSASKAYLLPTGGSQLKPLATAHTAWMSGEGRYVVWMQGNNASNSDDIFVYDVLTGTRKAVAPHAGPQWQPRIQGTKIVWTDHRNDPSGSRLYPRNSDIYMHDLATGVTKAVTTHSARQEWPDVWGDWVVWQDWRPSPDGISGKERDVYAKNIVTGQEVQISSGSHSDGYPRIDQGRILYRRRDHHSGLLALFLVELKDFLAAKKGP